jgi:KDEL-tailed cysteine endopeptidase
MGGVIKKFCGTGLNHGVAVVGWNHNEKGQDYWIVRNSWGTGWGNKGYLYIYRGDHSTGVREEGHGVCGINMNPAYAIME